MKRSKSLSFSGRRHIPLPTGRYDVGCFDIMTSYSKSGVFVRLYYPTQEKSVIERYMQWPLWIPSKEYINGCAIRMGVSPALLKFMKPALVGDVFIPAAWCAALSEEKFRYPVMIFSHGLGAWRTAYSTVCLEMASQGFVVASLEHRDHSACATFYKKQARMSFCREYPASCLSDVEEELNSGREEEWNLVVDGRWAPTAKSQSIGLPSVTTEWIYYDRVCGKIENSVRVKQLQIRAEECVKALDLLESIDSGKPIANVLDQTFRHKMFRGRLDFSRVAVAGHSFGGATAILALAIENRFRVGIAFDPWMFPFQEDQSSLSKGNQPFLAINTEHFQDDSSLRMLSALQRSDVERKFFSIRKAHHRDQCDVNFARRGWLQFFHQIGTGIERFTAMDLTSRLTLEFLGKHLDVHIPDECLDICSQREKYLKENTFG